MSIHVGYGYLTQGIRFFSPVWRCSVESPGENVCPEDGISTYMNNRVDGFIFSHIETIYLSDSFAHVRQLSYIGSISILRGQKWEKELSYMGKIPILHGQKWEKNMICDRYFMHNLQEDWFTSMGWKKMMFVNKSMIWYSQLTATVTECNNTYCVYVLRVYQTNWCMVYDDVCGCGCGCVFACAWMSFAWEVGVWFVAFPA